MSVDTFRDLWTIVLAAGDGTRLRSLTRALHGEDLPKQFSRIEADRSLLQSSVARALAWSVPENVVVVVSEDREELARSQLAAFGAVAVVPQPSNLGTGPGVLLPLARVLARDPDARVVVLPSDHFVREEAPFRQAVRSAAERSEASGALVLIGAVPDEPDPQYGWIVPRTGAAGELYVHCFEEKPNPAAAQRLLEGGALWNTFVLVASAQHLWQLAEQHLPEQSHALEVLCHDSAIDNRSLVSDVYSHLPAADFSRDVLEHADGLQVVALPECGWSDWGTPERVIASLRGTRELARLKQRLGGQPLPGGLAGD
jgi:mannose-1-phosphate guanylyltransferase